MNSSKDLMDSSDPKLTLGTSSTNIVALQASDEDSEERHPVDLLADEFAARCRRGERPSIDEYEARAPEYRDMIRSLFPMIAKIERVTSQSSQRRPVNRPVLPEHQVIGDFQIIREIGRGGMGIVYEAIQRSLDRKVALKVLSSGIANSPQQLQRFRREAEAAARLHHTNIVPVYGIGEENGVHFYAMQYIDGIPLAHAIETARRNSSIHHSSIFDASNESVHKISSLDPMSDKQHDPVSISDISNPTILMSGNQPDEVGAAISPHDSVVSTATDTNTYAVKPLSASDESDKVPIEIDSDAPAVFKELFSNAGRPDYFRRVAHLVEQVAEGLNYAHQHGVLHRDIKPSNLMLDESGMVWIMDFGLVKILEQHDLTQAGEIVGTLRYMAPEQLEGRSDTRTDIYGLGLTLYELITLTPAFDGDQMNTFAQRLQRKSIPRPRSINRAIPRDLETIVMKATAIEPSARYATAVELAEDLRRFCEDRAILARRATVFERFWRWSRRNPALATATATSIVLLVTISIVLGVSRMKVESALLDAKTAQARAERNVDSAIDVFDSILMNVTSRGLPKSLATNVSEAELGLMQTPLSAADALLLDRLLEFYRQFAAENATNVRLRKFIADSYDRAGAILLRLGRLEEAETDFRTAIAAFGKLQEANPKDVELPVKIAQIYNELGKVSLRRGDFRQTFLAHLEARAVLLDLPADIRTKPAVRFELSRAAVLLASIDVRSGTDSGPSQPPPKPHGKDGHPPHDGPPPDGPPPERRGEGRRQGRPRNPPMMEELSDRLKGAMPKTFKPGQPIGDGLGTILQEAIDELRLLVQEAPTESEYQYRLAQTLRLAVVNAASAGQPEIARHDFLEGRQIVNNLVSRFPDDPKYLFELANTLSQAARAESSEEAKDSLERAVQIAEQLFDRFPAVTEYQLLYGTTLARLASNQAARGLQNDAKHSLTTSIQILTPLAHQFPDQGTIQIPLAKNCQQLGELLCSMADGSPENAHYLERSRDELQNAITRFETYLSAPDEHHKSGDKGMFNMETCCNLYKSLARTLSRLDLPEEAEQAQARAARYARPSRPPRNPPP